MSAPTPFCLGEAPEPAVWAEAKSEVVEEKAAEPKAEESKGSRSKK